MKTGKKIDMTTGSIMKNVLLFALPICIGSVLQQLYNTVDTLVIGNFCGSVSLAAVGTSSQPVELLLCIFLGLGSGVSILVAQFMGSNNQKGLKEITATAISFLYLCAVPLSVLGLFIGPLILKLMQVPEDTFALANSYICIIFLGTLGNMGYNMNAGILRGMGDSTASLIFLLISCVVNIVLDLLFVAVFHMDVAGAAFATILAMYCSWLFSILYIRKNYTELSFTLLPKRLNRSMLMSIIKIGLPLGLNHSLYSVGHIMMQSLINMQGSVFMAACSVSGRITGMANIAINALSSSATTFAGQNMGAGNYVYLKKGGMIIPWFCGGITLAADIVITLCCRPILGLFTKDEAVLALAVRYIYVVLPMTFAFAILNSIINFVNGMGDVRYPTIVNLLMLWAVRIPAAWIIALFFDGTFVMAAIPVSFIFGMICMSCYYFTPKWKEIKRLARQQAAA